MNTVSAETVCAFLSSPFLSSQYYGFSWIVTVSKSRIPNDKVSF